MINYTIQAGDTLASIARQFLGNALRYRELATLNNIANPNVITIGQVLKIPTAADQLSPVQVTAKRIPVPGDSNYVWPLEEISGSAKRDYLPALIAAAILFYAFSDKRF